MQRQPLPFAYEEICHLPKNKKYEEIYSEGPWTRLILFSFLYPTSGANCMYRFQSLEYIDSQQIRSLPVVDKQYNFICRFLLLRLNLLPSFLSCFVLITIL